MLLVTLILWTAALAEPSRVPVARGLADSLVRSRSEPLFTPEAAAANARNAEPASYQEKAVRVVRASLPGRKGSLFDLSVCRAASGYVHNVTGVLRSEGHGRVWLVEFDGRNPKGEVDLEGPTDYQTEYYANIRALRHDRRPCHRLSDAAGDLANVDRALKYGDIDSREALKLRREAIAHYRRNRR